MLSRTRTKQGLPAGLLEFPQAAMDTYPQNKFQQMVRRLARPPISGRKLR